VTSSIRFSDGSLSFRSKYLRRRVVEIKDVLRVDRASRMLAYRREFPRIFLRDGQYCDLLPFEEPVSRATDETSSVSQVIALINGVLNSEP
jgi:hypothetical protein